ncbi:hypothetical protein [Rhodoplanes sp. Z2-YC6860]|uniref:hypothetical protein n=1 Tax=Rhodoplanes sp. Z2-YC6860 TaxID=674703 RepID=UPI0012EE4244|nr:hypothetical protein [Rhodoplanes sp. Z2-YC6860]
MTAANSMGIVLAPGLHALRLTKREVMRGTLAGVAFCIVLTAGFAAMSAWQCGGVCLPETLDNAMLSLAAGLLGLGPVAAYGGRR